MHATWYDLVIDRQNWRDEETWFASKGLFFDVYSRVYSRVNSRAAVSRVVMRRTGRRRIPLPPVNLLYYSII